MSLPGVSIVIPNYNYERFVGEAIESALAQDHPDCEVIVVDDCSTDGSRAVIERYTDRVRVIFQPANGGQVAAINAAWPEARYPILIFLDSDDMLEPHAATTIARTWGPGVAKVQFPMASIDADGRSLGHVAPKYPARLDTETIRRELLRTGTCPATQGSGNAYAKRFLETIAPIGGLPWMDTMLEVNAPFHGEVVTLTEPLARYRIHGSNWSQQTSLHVERFLKHLTLYEDKAVYLREFLCQRGMEFDLEAAKRRSIWYLEYLMAASCLLPSGDERRVPPRRVFQDAVGAVLGAPLRRKRKGLLLLCFGVMAFSPLPVAKRLASIRFIIANRPRWVEAVIGYRPE